MISNRITNAFKFAAFGLMLTTYASISTAAPFAIVDPPQNTADSEKVEVLEFFWLGCPHCHQFEPAIEAWKADKPDYVKFVREAPPLNSSWESHSRGFYAAQLLGFEQEFVEAMFTAIHENKKRMRKPEAIAELAAGLGMDKEKFLKTMKSFAVEGKLKRAMLLAKGAGINGVPAILINGKYRTGSRLADGNGGMINVINDRVEVERKAMNIAAE
ncbi:MAG: thiol:disulfide interchange protein DsbA/DsbL [Granulosicoccaceae bacterium]